MDYEFLSPQILKRAEAYFNKYDQNKNNSIDMNELKSLMTDLANDIQIPVPSEQDVSIIMDDTDINKDNRISKQEFVNLFKIIYKMKSISKK